MESSWSSPTDPSVRNFFTPSVMSSVVSIFLSKKLLPIPIDSQVPPSFENSHIPDCLL
jgi:hypothetical protein